MSIFGPGSCSSGNGDDMQDYAKKSYVDAQGSLRVLKAGDTMNGTLNMSGNSVRGLPTTYPPLFRGDEAVSWSQAYALVQNATQQMDGIKPLITIWAEENAGVEAGKHEWSFGNGAAGTDHALSGYPMLESGRVLRMGLACSVTHAGNAREDPDAIPVEPGAVTVAIVVNGEETTFGVHKPVGSYSKTVTFASPLELSQGDRINFVTGPTTDSNIQSAIVSLLIELDIMPMQ